VKKKEGKTLAAVLGQNDQKDQKDQKTKTDKSQSRMPQQGFGFG
jgi:hypothetical protein